MLIISLGQVSEVMKIGAQAIKQNGVTVEDVEHCLDELEEGILSQKQVEKAFGITSSGATNWSSDMIWGSKFFD